MKITKDALILAQALGGGGGITPSGTISISSNGSHNVEAFAMAEVLVPASAVDVGTKSISANGIHDVVGFANVDVNVGGITPSGTKSISTNGVHDVATFEDADVNVPIEGVDFTPYLVKTMTALNASAFSGSIPNEAFMSFTSLSAVYLPLCNRIGQSAFTGCTSLTSVDAAACTVVDNFAFLNCTKLDTANIPSVSSIGNSAFLGTKLQEIVLSSCLYVGQNAFSSCNYLIRAILPLCGTIQMNAFAECRNLAEASVARCGIYSWAFNYCGKLSTFTMAATGAVNGYIASGAFNHCEKLLLVYILASSLMTLSNSGAFNSTPIAGYTTQTGGVEGTIYVPSSLLATYQSATNWAYFSSRMVGV